MLAIKSFLPHTQGKEPKVKRSGMGKHCPCPVVAHSAHSLVQEEPWGSSRVRAAAGQWLLALLPPFLPLGFLPSLTCPLCCLLPSCCPQLVFFIPFSHFLFPAQCATPSPPTSPASPTPPTNPLSSEPSRVADCSHFMRV